MLGLVNTLQVYGWSTAAVGALILIGVSYQRLPHAAGWVAYWLIIGGYLPVIAGDLEAREWPAAAIAVASLVYFVWLFWRWYQRHHKNRRRTAALASEKARLIRARLVRRMRERARPRRVYQPGRVPA